MSIHINCDDLLALASSSVQEQLNADLQPTISYLPPEIWQIILRYAISVPIFFSTDPIESYGVERFIASYNEESIYWESERQRNALRRVCLPWNAYLQHFNHRYVKLDDVLHGHVSVHAISQAIRFNHNLKHSNFVFSARVMKEALEFGPKEWPLEILHGEGADFNVMILRGKRAVGLKSIFKSSGIYLEDVKQSAPRLSLLHLLYGPADDAAFLNMVNLTTLSIDIPSLDVIRTWNLPNLQHFSFVASDLRSSELVQALQNIGKNLLTLYDNSWNCGGFLPHEIWTLCPRLQKMQTSFLWPPDIIIPHTLQSIRCRIRPYLDPNIGPPFPAQAMAQAGMWTVHFIGRWFDALFEYEGWDAYLTLAMDYGVVLLDEEGVSFETFLVAILKYICKGRTDLPRILLSVDNCVF